MALASSADVELALGRELTDAEDVSNLLDTASDAVIAFLGGEPDPVPPAVTRAVADVVVACLTKPAVTTADYQASGYNTNREATAVRVGVESATTTGPWLPKSIKARLAPYRVASSRAAFSVVLIDDEGS